LGQLLVGVRHGIPDDKYEAWIDPVVQEVCSLADHEPFDHVLATGNPYASFEAARRIGEQLKTPFSIDYRDPWTIDVFTAKRARLPRAVRERERAIVTQAAACIHVNQPLADVHAELFVDAADRQYAVLNGYDEESIPPVVEPRSGPLRFGMLGTANSNWPLDAVFAGWSRVLPSLPDGSQLVLAGHLGYFARSAVGLRGSLPEQSESFGYVGPVPKLQVADFYAGLDVVVVPVPGGEFVTSGKVFEAAALGIPIVCVQAAGGGARKVLESHPHAFVSEPDGSSVAAAMCAAADCRDRLTVDDIKRARVIAAQFERTSALREMVKVIEDSSP